MSEQDNQAFLTKIQQTACCPKNCFNTSINHDEALKRFCKIRLMTPAEKNMFFLGILEASVRPATNRGEIKQYMTSNYNFQGVSVCQNSWLTIYAIGKSKWEAIRTHYSKNNISPIVHGLKGRVSNHALKFETVLHILTFIRNFSTQHGLPSPGNV